MQVKPDDAGGRSALPTTSNPPGRSSRIKSAHTCEAGFSLRYTFLLRFHCPHGQLGGSIEDVVGRLALSAGSLARRSWVARLCNEWDAIPI